MPKNIVLAIDEFSTSSSMVDNSSMVVNDLKEVSELDIIGDAWMFFLGYLVKVTFFLGCWRPVRFPGGVVKSPGNSPSFFIASSFFKSSSPPTAPEV